jgi:hypothetical protein
MRLRPTGREICSIKFLVADLTDENRGPYWGLAGRNDFPTDAAQPDRPS